MIRMEIALILVLLFIACMYFSAECPHTLLHKTFSVLLITVIVHLVFDAATIYTVNHLDRVPAILNRILHRMFIGTMALVVYLFYQYIAILVQEETGKTRLLDTAARMFLVVAEIGVNFLAYLTNIRMEQAKKLLLSMPLSIAEVSERSGYGDYRVFTKAFKKSEGVTPSPYRRNFLEE